MQYAPHRTLLVIESQALAVNADLLSVRAQQKLSYKVLTFLRLIEI